MAEKKCAKITVTRNDSGVSDSEVLKVKAFADGILDIFGVDTITIERTWRRKNRRFPKGKRGSGN